MTDFEDGDRLTKRVEVSEYLRENPSFFVDNPSVLADMTIPHNTGAATSLVEMQISALRKENRKLRHEIADIVEIAKENEGLSSKLHVLSLNLIGASCSEEILSCFENALLGDFGADYIRTLLFLGEEEAGTKPNEESPKGLNVGRAFFETVLEKGIPECGELDFSLATFVFGEDAVVRSGVVLPLLAQDWDGVVVIGSKNADHYNSGMGTDFLMRMADLLVRLLDYHLQKNVQRSSEARGNW
jgi:uncharacterized protein YigA (DUF484 family)